MTHFLLPFTFISKLFVSFLTGQVIDIWLIFNGVLTKPLTFSYQKYNWINFLRTFHNNNESMSKLSKENQKTRKKTRKKLKLMKKYQKLVDVIFMASKNYLNMKIITK